MNDNQVEFQLLQGVLGYECGKVATAIQRSAVAAKQAGRDMVVIGDLAEIAIATHWLRPLVRVKVAVRRWLRNVRER